MKESIFTKPVFINPQAYLIIPELITISKCISLTSNSYTFEINTNGKIEGKLLNNGNNSILHLDYYGILGNVVLGEFIIDVDYNTNKDSFNLNQIGNLITIQN